MKLGKKSLIIMLVLNLILLAVGCTSTTQTQSASELSTSEVNTGATNARPDRVPDLEGKVKQIRGNEITILKVIRTAPEMTEAEKAKNREQMQNLTPEERAQKQAERFKVTDETVDLTIPVGIPLVSNQNMGGKVASENVSLADIKQGNLLRLWFANGSADEIIFVQVNKFGQ